MTRNANNGTRWGRIEPPRLPDGSPVDAMVRRAAEVPADSWVAPVGAAMNQAAWRPVLSRFAGSEYMTFSHTTPSRGLAAETSKFPRDVYVAWCRSKPRFPRAKNVVAR